MDDQETAHKTNHVKVQSKTLGLIFISLNFGAYGYGCRISTDR